MTGFFLLLAWLAWTMECHHRRTRLGKCFPLGLDSFWKSSPLFADYLGYLWIRKTRMLRDDSALIMLAIEDEGWDELVLLVTKRKEITKARRGVKAGSSSFIITTYRFLALVSSDLVDTGRIVLLVLRYSSMATQVKLIVDFPQRPSATLLFS